MKLNFSNKDLLELEAVKVAEEIAAEAPDESDEKLR